MALVVGVVKTHWSGTSGGPGLTQMAFQSQTDPHTWDAAAAQTVVNAVRTFWGNLPTYLPNDITLQVDPVVDVFNIMDAGLVGTYTAATTPTAVSGSDVNAFAMASGLKLTLKTGSILNRRRVHGGLFLVPAAGACFDTSGNVVSGAVTAITNAANTLLTSTRTANAGWCVWSRPHKAFVSLKRDGTTINHPARDGAASDITGFTLNTRGATLRGRRD